MNIDQLSNQNLYQSKISRAKRTFDFVSSLLALVILSPVLPFIALAIALTSRGPIFYRQLRVGKSTPEKMEIFEIMKFRSMYQDAETRSGAVWATQNDPRITPVGRFLRKTRLDELPQLFSILKGDMSFVGPRPALFNQDDLIALRSENDLDKLIPGLTGWAQVNGRDELSIPEKVALEVEYMQKKSFWFDIKILWMTFLKVINNQGVLH